MSYTRRFKRTITVHYSGSVSYPASQSGGRVSYSGSTEELVEFRVHVDTDDFDKSIHQVNEQVDLLTGSVVATKAAQVDTIYETNDAIGNAVIAGFFKTIKSDVSQQITELKTRTESLLLQLNKLAGRCNDKRRQMGVDYQRIASRYTKIFEELNNELKNRVYSVDEPVFRVADAMDGVGSKSVVNDHVSIVSVSAGENAKVHSVISGNIVKNQAANAIGKAKDFLHIQNRTDRLLQKCLLPGAQSATFSSPYFVIDTTAPGGIMDRQLYKSPLLNNVPEDRLAAGFDGRGRSATVSRQDAEAIESYYRAETAQYMANAAGEHERRVADLMARMFDLSNTATPL